jgi:hypothetical protein
MGGREFDEQPGKFQLPAEPGGLSTFFLEKHKTNLLVADRKNRGTNASLQASTLAKVA